MTPEGKYVKHLSIILLPPLVIGGFLILVSQAEDSKFDGGSLTKVLLQAILFIALLVNFFAVINYYSKKIEERCRGPRQNESADTQSYRMQQLHYRRLPCGDPRAVDTEVVYEDTYV